MFHISHLEIVESSLVSGVLFPAFGIDLVFVAVVSLPSFSPVSLQTFLRFRGLLRGTIYEMVYGHARMIHRFSFTLSLAHDKELT